MNILLSRHKNMMRTINAMFIILLYLFFFTTSNASPTSNEFIKCNKIAVGILEACLNYKESECWIKSKAHYASCQKRVIQSHHRDLERMNAEKKRIKEIEKK